MRRPILAALAAAALAVSAAPAAAAHADPPRAVQCPGIRFFYNTDTPRWVFEVRMTSDPGAICDIRGAVQCKNRAGGHHWFNGGWVHPLGVESGVNCNSTYPTAVKGNVDWSDDGGAIFSYETVVHY
jgi:hypothetical protein